MFRKIKSFTSVPWSTRLLFAEAVFTSVYVKITLILLPYRKVAKWLGVSGKLNTTTREEQSLKIIEKVRFAIRLCDKYTPWPTECYTRALTGKIILNRRKIDSTLFLGFCREATGEMKGHAWLQSSGLIVTGFCDFSKYSVLTSFT